MKPTIPETIPCRCCHGLGRILNPAKIGEAYRNRREAKGLTLRGVAKCVGISAMYLSDLERGQRNWNATIEQKINKALK